jgi:GT2 family glycosyltransferase
VKVTVVIPTHNGERFLGPCLDALERTRLPDGDALEIVVVDNGSNDGTAQLLAARPHVKALFFERSLGFSHANNAARAVSGGDVVAFLNNDTAVDPGWLSRPLEILRSDRRVAAVGSKLLFMHPYTPVRIAGGRHAFIASAVCHGPLGDKVRYRLPTPPEEERDGVRGRWLGPDDVAYVPAPIAGIDGEPVAPPVLRVLSADAGGPLEVRVGGAVRTLRRVPGIVPLEGHEARATVRLVQNVGNYVTARGEGGDVGSGEEDRPDVPRAEEIVPALCGAALIVRRSALDAAGWFPSYYTMYYEDSDLCMRLRQAGGLLVSCPSSVVSHYHTGTSREFSPRFIEHVSRSTLLFVARYGRPGLVARTLARKVRDSARELRHAGGRNVVERLRAANGSRGFASGLLALPRVLADRALAPAAVETSALFGAERSPYVPPSAVGRTT